MEHSIVNKYSNMITEEVNRYKNEMLNYFHARQIDGNKSNTQDSSSSSSSSHQYYTTSLTRTIYELEGYMNNELNFTRHISITNDNEESKTLESNSDDHSRLKSISYDQDQSQVQTFLTEDPTSTNEINPIPFYEAFRIPSNLVNSIMLK